MTLYNPRHFAMTDEQAIRRVLTECGFATLITSVAGDIVVSHVPVLFDPVNGPRGTLLGHVAAANPHASALGQGTTFVVLQGPFGYVSPNWYTQPAASVPTWNYVALHVHGSVERSDSIPDKQTIVDALTTRHESGFDQPWTSAKMDPAMLEKLLGAIVGFRLLIGRIDAKFKLGQNRSSADRAGVIAGLQARESPAADALAAWMREYAGD